MHLGMSYQDIRNLPLSYRRWYVDRLLKHFKKKNKTTKKHQENTSQNNSKSPEDLKKIEKIFKKFS